MKRKSKKGKQFFPFLIFFIFLLLLLFLLEEITPIAIIKNIENQNVFFRKFHFYQKEFVFNVFADNHNTSLLSRSDIENLNEDNLIIFMNKSTPPYFEGKFGKKYVFILNDAINCKPLFSLSLEKNNLLFKIRNLKFHLFYRFNEGKAFYYKYKNLQKSLIFENFDPVKDICFVGVNEGIFKEKYIKDGKKVIFPKLEYQLKLIRNVLYLEKEFPSFYKKKENYINQINKGHLYTYFFKNPQIRFIVYTKDKVYTFGDLIPIGENPIIFFSVKPKYVTAVYINGKLEKYYKGSFSIRPKSAGFYQFVVFDYLYKIPFVNLFLGFDIVAITNPIYFE